MTVLFAVFPIPGSSRRSLASLFTCVILLSLLSVSATGCGESAEFESPEESSEPSGAAESPPIAPPRTDLHDHAAIPQTTLLDRPQIQDRFSDDRASFDSWRPFHQVSLMFDAPPNANLEWRRPTSDKTWSPWQPIEVTWSEDRAHVGRIILDEPARKIEMRYAAAPSYLHLEFPPRVTARTDGPLTRDLPRVRRGPRPEGDLRTTRQLEAPDGMVIDREEWGARDPDKICGREHNPYRISIHHTASPADDGGDPAQRMRQMQAFHIDDRGWCDIGYHFVVSQSADIFQGRSTEERTGAHVLNENTGNIGISLIGNFNNQSVNSEQFAETITIAHWVHDTYDITLDRDQVRGHREWPGQSTSCPGDNLKSRLDELLKEIRQVDNSDGSSWELGFETKIEGLDNPYVQGSSEEIPDAFPDDSFRAEIFVTNKSAEAIDGVRAGLELDTSHLVPESYTIYDDHPEHDRQSWSENDANSNPDNPESLSAEESIELHAFSPGETKRIAINLRASGYSVGSDDPPTIRSWIRSIDGLYETQTVWSDSPDTNAFGRRLRDDSRVDVLSRDEWRFENTETQNNLEGWTACCEGQFERLALNHEAGALSIRLDSSNVALESPDWTRIHAEKFDEMVIRHRSHDGPHEKRLSWRREGAANSEQSSVRFRAEGDGDFHTSVVPVGEDSAWNGTVTGVDFRPLNGEEPSEGDERWYDIDAIYFRSSETGETSTEREAFEDLTERELLDEEDEGDSTSSTSSRPTSNARRETTSSAADIEVKGGGCSSGPGEKPVGLAWLALCVAAAGRLRTKTKR